MIEEIANILGFCVISFDTGPIPLNNGRTNIERNRRVPTLILVPNGFALAGVLGRLTGSRGETWRDAV